MRTALLCLAALLCATGVSAQEKPTPESEAQANQLPEPGSWVKFLLSQEGSEGNGTLTVKMLDVVPETNGPYRRIEFDWLIELGHDKQRVVTQYLLSEKSLLTQKTPFDSLKEIRTVTFNGSRLDEGPILESEVSTPPVDGETKENLNSFGWEFLFPGPRLEREIEQIELEVEYQHGKLMCPRKLTVVQTSDLSHLVAANADVDKYFRQTNFQIWLHSKVPFGIAHFEQRRTDIGHDEGGKVLGVDPQPLMTWTLNDFGTGAKSSLPTKP